MLAPKNRVRSSRDINRVYARGRFGAGGQMTVKTLRTGLPESRLAVVVSRKVSKKAVVRNRIRRRLAALAAELWQTVTPGCDIVVTVRGDLTQASPAELKQQLVKALTQSGALTTKG